MCDDDEVSPVHEEDVLKLSGGGDWHTAYLLLYAPRFVIKFDNKFESIPGSFLHVTIPKYVILMLFKFLPKLTNKNWRSALWKMFFGKRLYLYILLVCLSVCLFVSNKRQTG